MTSYKLLAAAALLSMATATPVLAQAVIEEPGAYAFYHPNGDLGIGSAPPMESMGSLPLRHSGSMAQARIGMMPHHVHARHVRSAKVE
jgi:hypothetical protein